ncbi:hypothetical protein VM1G_02714 [Cytospora mali]|uniref:THOC5 family protein n=1 Tax=Cytospora mali TaxID=578113 RepID=A0A194VSX5_CYTMA|nr:hypothetical protein VM1G_02714 [Valsa mali]
MDQPQTSMTPADGSDGLKATASPPKRRHPTHRARAPLQHRRQQQQQQQQQQQPRRPISSLTTQPIPHATMTIDAIVTDPALRSFLQTSQHAREQALGLADRLADAAPLRLTPDQRIELSKEQKLLNTNLSHLRGLHRAACLGARDTKTQTAEARQEVDVLHLQLQNLYYEQRHLQGEIAACESFDHEYQKLPLVPVEEFLAKHHEYAGSDENALMIARIEDERAEREGLEQQRQELLKRKQKLIAENKKRREDLANLDNDLEKFIDAAKPIQKTFEKVV